MTEKIIEHILQNPSGTKTETIIINGQNYEIIYNWKRRIQIKIKPAQDLFQDMEVCEIRRNHLMSIIARYPNYNLLGKRTELTEKLLSNKYTPVLLNFPVSKLICENNQLSYAATIRKKHLMKLEIIIRYFDALLATLK
ncbi:MAG: hypothetical protein JJE55_04890 [Flavobacteriaceae bacterium]|nr:hypothetical protein [Flavobacteriaceae bacterium]